jgi:hypothetical protein
MRWPPYKEEEGHEREDRDELPGPGKEDLANSSPPPRLATNPLISPPMPISTPSLEAAF